MSTDDDLVRPPSLWPRLLVAVVVLALAGWVVVTIISSLLRILFTLGVVALIGVVVWRLIAGSGSSRASR